MGLISPIYMPRLPFVVVVLTVMMLVAAACGRDDAGPPSSTSKAQGQSSTETSSEEQATDTLAPTIQADSASGNPSSDSTVSPSPTPEEAQQSVDPTEEVAAKSPGDSQAALAQPMPVSTEGLVIGGEVGNRAPEFQGIANWIDSEPLIMEELQGKVVLIDFWTYTCVNCIRTFPFLRDWNAKYSDKGLVIVGVHTPEFDFEKLTKNVEESIAEYNLTWPVAQDNDFGTWRAYSNRFWPAKYLVDSSGVVRYTHFGEGAYIETEEQIRDLLQEAGADLSEIQVGEFDGLQADARAYTVDPATRLTREIYGGFDRNATAQGIYIAHVEYYEGPNQDRIYTDPGEHQNNFMYLQGPWVSGPENLRHGRTTTDYSDYIGLKFVATSVNAVIDPDGGEPFEVQVTIDGRPLRSDEAGADIVIEDGRSFFHVDEPRMYEVVALPEFGGHELKLSSNSPDFAFFAFTFGAYSEGP